MLISFLLLANHFSTLSSTPQHTPITTDVTMEWGRWNQEVEELMSEVCALYSEDSEEHSAEEEAELENRDFIPVLHM